MGIDTHILIDQKDCVNFSNPQFQVYLRAKVNFTSGTNASYELSEHGQLRCSVGGDFNCHVLHLRMHPCQGDAAEVGKFTAHLANVGSCYWVH